MEWHAVCHHSNCSLCPPWLRYGQREGSSCAVVYVNPGWGWGRSEEARGGGGPFSSSAQHKPVRKQADSFNNINESQTSGKQILRLWGPAGPSDREIVRPLPTLQNLDMCLLREEKSVFLTCDCSNRMSKISPRGRWISGVKSPSQCEDLSLNDNFWESGFGFLRKIKGFLKNKID